MGERWDRDRFMYERARDQGRFDDDRSYMRGGRGRDHSDERHDRRPNRSFDEDDMVRDRRYYEETRYMPQRERDAPPAFARRGVLEKERDRDYFPRRDSPPRRPGFLRRQSSLDTFDRRPSRLFQEREEYPPPARREDIRRTSRDDYRAPAYTPIPLPKTRGLPPPRRYPDQGFYDDIKVAEPDLYGDDDFRPYPERVHEREYTRTRKSRHRSRSRGRSRDSHSTRTRSVRSSSYTSSTSSRSSSSSGGTTVRSEYPKKGKTRIPAKLVSKRALIDLGYPFFEEGNTIIVQKALGQDNIDELLKVSEDYKKVEAEIAASRKPAPAALPPPPAQGKAPASTAPPAQAPAPIRPPPAQAAPAPAPTQVPAPAPPAPKPAPPQEVRQPVAAPAPAPAPAPGPPAQTLPPPPPIAKPVPGPVPAPVIMNPAPQPAPVEIIDETVIRDVSPSRTSTSFSSWDSFSTHHHHQPVELAHRSRSRSRSGREIRREIRALERELAHRPRGRSTSGEIVRAERLPDGQLVIMEDRLEKVVEHRKPPRIEKDKKGPPPALMRAMFATLT